MNQDLKGLVEEFERAINESVCESDRIAAIVTDIKRAGYDITLVLEATIGVTTRSDQDDYDGTTSVPRQVRATPTGHIELSEEDQHFLQALKISA